MCGIAQHKQTGQRSGCMANTAKLGMAEQRKHNFCDPEGRKGRDADTEPSHKHGAVKQSETGVQKELYGMEQDFVRCARGNDGFFLQAQFLVEAIEQQSRGASETRDEPGRQANGGQILPGA